MARDLRWSISAARVTRLLQALDDTGELDWAPVEGIDQLKSGLSERLVDDGETCLRFGC